VRPAWDPGGADPEAAPALASIATVAAPARHAAASADPEIRAFGKAVVFGALIGFPALAAVIAALVLIVAPSTEPAAVAGIAVWVGLFCGPFLGGTVTVGLSSRHRH
jgi:hypothetical protein